MKKFKLVISVILCLCMLPLALSFASCSEDKEIVTEIVSIELDGKGESLNVKATLEESYAENHSKDTLYLLGLPTADPDGNLDGAVVIAEARAKKSMSFKFDLYDGALSRLAYGFVVAEKNGDGYSALTDVSYVSNPDKLASSSKGNLDVSGIKGLNSYDVPMSQILGTEHILFDAGIESLLLGGFDRDAVAFNYDGSTYYFDRDAVRELDALVSDADRLGMRVYLRTSLGNPKVTDEFGRSDISFLYFKGAKDADGYLPNLTDPDVMRHVKAYYAFLADRYPVADYIIGEGVNNYGENCNAGKVTAEEFESVYYTWTRTAYIILASVNSSATVYIPIDNVWSTDAKDGMMSSKVFLSHFAADAKSSGDYPYAISLDLGDGEDLPALLSGKGNDYSRIGADTLSYLSDLLDKAEFRYKSERRRYIIDALSLSSDVSEANKAAYYTLAYYNAAQNGYGAFISSTPLYSDGVTRSELYYASLMCGSDMTSQLSGYTNKLVNVSVPSFSDYKTLDLTYSQKATLEVTDSVVKNKKDFPCPLNEFTQGGSVYKYGGNVILNDDGSQKSAWIIESDATSLTGSVSAFSIPAKDIVGSAYVGITMSSDSAASFALVIRNEDGGKAACLYVGEAKIANASTTYYFNISEFTKDVESSDTLSISLCIIPEGDSEESIEITDISLYGASGNGGNTVIVIIIVAVILLAIVGLIVVLAINRKKKTQEKSKSKDAD